MQHEPESIATNSGYVDQNASSSVNVNYRQKSASTFIIEVFYTIFLKETKL